ncbi:MAG: hypothetical protein K8W52_40770 [Deltaproteobacteria bacterium]|nr:hypothetical protein [Deltaproteobacteria bacterium]
MSSPARTRRQLRREVEPVRRGSARCAMVMWIGVAVLAVASAVQSAVQFGALR